MERESCPPPELAPCPPEGCQGLGPPPPRSLGSLLASLAIVAGLLVVQIVGYFLTRSLVIAFDALHVFVDVGAIALALFAAWIARRPATNARTFGYYRAEILAALANGAALVAITLLLGKEAYDRLTDASHDPPLEPRLMIVFGGIGLVANLTNAFILHRGHQHAHGHDAHEGEREGEHEHEHDRAAHPDLNYQGAFLHIVGDVLGSIGAVAAGVIILATGWKSADAVMAAFMSVLILARDVLLCLRAVDVLLESAPRHVDVPAFEAALRRVPGIRDVHDLHVWTLTSGVYAMSCHALVEPGSEHRRILADLNAVIRERFGIAHTTIQLEEHAEAAAVPVGG